MLVILLFHVEEEMISLSNIIKRTRIRSTVQIDLGKLSDKEEETTQEVNKEEANGGSMLSPEELQKISDEHQKRLEEFEIEIQKMQKAVDIKIEGQLRDTTIKCVEMEKSSKQQYDEILSSAQMQKETLLKQAKEEADRITANAQKERNTLINNVENEIVQTIMTLLEHIVGEGMVGSADWIKILIRKMLKVHHTIGELKLFVSEHNMHLIKEDETAFRNGLPSHLEIEQDDALNDTQCYLMTSEGTIEYDVHEGLKQVINDLKVLNKLS